MAEDEENEEFSPPRALGDSDMSDEELAGEELKTGEIMIHPRSDCPIYRNFKKTFKQTKVIPENELFCEKCYCYICDIPASQCKNWRDMSLRHCNAYHTKDGPWKLVRQKVKELKNKQESLLELKRKLRDERKEYRDDL